MTYRQKIRAVYPNAVSKYILSPHYPHSRTYWYEIWTDTTEVRDRKKLSIGRPISANDAWKIAYKNISKQKMQA